MIKRSGFIMIIVMILVLVLTIVALGLSAWMTYSASESIQEVSAVRNYYSSLAALRYSHLLSQSPASYGLAAGGNVRGTEIPGTNLANELGVPITTNLPQVRNSLFIRLTPINGMPGLFDGDADSEGT